jgi:hypothetical protein
MNQYLLLALVCSIGAGACRPQANELWIEPGSTADSLVFGIGKKRGGDPVDQFGVLRVYPCEGNQVGSGANWVLFQQEEGPAVRYVVYGVTPPRYRTGEGPLPLNTGCYQAIATTGGIVEFNVLPNRTIKEVDPRIRWD